MSIVGSIASLASRLMGGITKKLSGAFFDCLQGKDRREKQRKGMKFGPVPAQWAGGLIAEPEGSNE